MRNVGVHCSRDQIITEVGIWRHTNLSRTSIKRKIEVLIEILPFIKFSSFLTSFSKSMLFLLLIETLACHILADIIHLRVIDKNQQHLGFLAQVFKQDGLAHLRVSGVGTAFSYFGNEVRESTYQSVSVLGLDAGFVSIGFQVDTIEVAFNAEGKLVSNETFWVCPTDHRFLLYGDLRPKELCMEVDIEQDIISEKIMLWLSSQDRVLGGLLGPTYEADGNFMMGMLDKGIAMNYQNRQLTKSWQGLQDYGIAIFNGALVFTDITEPVRIEFDSENLLVTDAPLWACAASFQVGVQQLIVYKGWPPMPFESCFRIDIEKIPVSGNVRAL